ncbi:MAG: hypothetical protein A2Z95_09950 [Gallionellales bacterium GWA2_60_18]|nr:MAG: hypothetical protein A2Z95_09950 [Gallionellales bacterium GWA2_60_18]
MINLPINSHKTQPADSTASALPTDSLADTQAAEPFAFLLAQQIGATDLSTPDAALAAIAMDANAADGSTGLPIEDAQDTAGAVAGMPDNQASIIAALLQQLPAAEDKGVGIDAQQAARPITLNSPKTDGLQAMQPITLTPPQKANDFQTMPGAATENGRNRSVEILAADQATQASAIDRLSLEAVKRAELLSGLTQPAQSTPQTVVSPSGYAAMPGTLTNNMPSTGAAPTITTPVGQHGWAEEFSQKISWIGTQQNQVAELRLNPPNLGPLDVVLKISDNQATALFASPHGAVRDAVENALPKLREILADNGITLGNTTISDQAPRDRDMDGFRGQGFGTAAQREVDDTASGSSGAPPATAPIRRHNGMVDTFA